MPFNVPGAVFLAVDLLCLLAAVIIPLNRRYDDSDRGSGSFVVLPPAHRSSLWRVAAFVGVVAAVCLVIVGLRRPGLTQDYRNLVGLMVEYVYRVPAEVNTYTSAIKPVVPTAVIASVVALAVTVRATPGRRLMIVAHGLLFIAISALCDAWLTIFALKTGLALGPYPLISIVLHYSIAFLLVLRLAFTTYRLPRRTHVPLLRPRNLADDIVTLAVVVAALTVVGSLAVRASMGTQGQPVLLLIVVLAIPNYVKYGLFTGLWLVGILGGRRRPHPGAERPLINVIAPAFNEAGNIVRWVEAIDAAAARYGGPVELYLCDDGSTDDTRVLAEGAIARCKALRGVVVPGAHKGKSTALNQALRRCTAELVIRIDTDCVVDADAFLFIIPWFLEHPEVGLVGAYSLPKQPFTSWIHRIRCFEVGGFFALQRAAWPVIDGVPCIPGPYSAFRREPALAIGGFTEGLFGEDVDFTCNLARLGYRAVYDRRVWSYEDVPNTSKQLLLQRLRWNRGGIMNYARFMPMVAGFAGPRLWFVGFIRAGRRLMTPIHAAVVIYTIESSFFTSSYRVNLWHFAAVYVLARAPTLIVSVLSMVYWHLARVLWWYPLTFWFALLKRIANIDALVTFRTRPVRLPSPTPRMAPGFAPPTEAEPSLEAVS